MLAGKRILLIIGGGIAAFKSLDLIRRLRERGATVVPVLTNAAEQFVTPLSVSALAAEKVYRDLFNLTDEAEMGHIELSRDADLIVVAPATADLMAKMAGGHADDLASTILMATDKRVLIAPSMNVRMWEHAATQRNLVTLQDDGVLVVGPNEGDMACGEYGPGRMAEPMEIVAAVESALMDGPLKGKHVLVTSGPTHEPIDPVRYIANRSSGSQGTAIARSLSALGAKVTFVTGPADVPPPDGVAVIRVQTAREHCRIGCGLANGRGCTGKNQKGVLGRCAGSAICRESGHAGDGQSVGCEPPGIGCRFRGRDRKCRSKRNGQTQTQGLRLDCSQRRVSGNGDHGWFRECGDPDFR